MVRVSRRLIFWLGGSLAGLVLLVVLAVAIAVLVIDPNRYKGRIAAAVRERTGRELTLTGDLGWSVFPWLVVRTGAGQLGDAPAPDGVPSGTPFASWQALRLGVRLMPLLRERQFILDRVSATGLVLNLRRDAAGRANWEFTAPGAAVSPPTAGATDAPAPTALQVDAVELRDASISFDDERTNAHWRLTAVKLDARIPSGVTTAAPAVERLAFAAHVQGGPLPGAGVDVALQAPRASFDTRSKAFDLSRWSARFAGAELAGTLQGNAAGPMRASGTVQAKAASLRDVLADAGIQPPRTQDAKVLGPFELAGTLELAGDALRVAPVSLTLDDTRLSGSLGVPSLEKGEVVFELAGDGIVLDRYLEPKDAASKPFELPLAQLKALRANGTLTLERAQMAGAKLEHVRFTVVTGK